MHSSRLSATRSRWQRKHTVARDEDSDISESSISSLSRPNTQESKRSTCSRLSTDSGAGSLDDINSRRYSSPDFWRDGIGRRHTAPIKKTFSPTEDIDEVVRPNTVHAWDGCSTRCSLSRYAPLPAIGVQKENLEKKEPEERPFPVRRQCFMGPLDIDNADITLENDVNENQSSYISDVEEKNTPPLFSLTLESDSDSDFDEDSDNTHLCLSEEDEQKPKRTLIRSATFTIEKDRPDIRGPFVSVAVRLPDGTRVADRFDCKDMLASVCNFALSKIDGSRPQKYSLVTTDVPKRVFKDLTLTLKGAGIDDKTLLCLQSLDDSDSD